jgi:hypothetical protein
MRWFTLDAAPCDCDFLSSPLCTGFLGNRSSRKPGSAFNIKPANLNHSIAEGPPHIKSYSAILNHTGPHNTHVLT